MTTGRKFVKDVGKPRPTANGHFVWILFLFFSVSSPFSPRRKPINIPLDVMKTLFFPEDFAYNAAGGKLYFAITLLWTVREFRCHRRNGPDSRNCQPFRYPIENSGRLCGLFRKTAKPALTARGIKRRTDPVPTGFLQPESEKRRCKDGDKERFGWVSVHWTGSRDRSPRPYRSPRAILRFSPPPGVSPSRPSADYLFIFFQKNQCVTNASPPPRRHSNLKVNVRQCFPERKFTGYVSR